MMKQGTLLFTFLVLLVALSCKKEGAFTKNHLDFSTDSLLFDTVFTTVGSTTKRFKIYNNNPGKIKIDEIQLMGGDNSPFRINIDGVPGVSHRDIEINGKDSLFGFVEVTLAVNNATNPLVISDSIRFLTNGLNQYLHLDVWGQDAYFHSNELVADEIELWSNDKPHVLYGRVAVGYPDIDSNLTLTIPQGTQIYCHKEARLIVYKSRLDIQGTLGNEVVFQGDRLESFYDDVSGQWWGIRMVTAKTSSINHTIIKNSAVGLQIDSTDAPVTLNMSNTIIDNSDYYNLLAVAGPIVNVENCVFGSAGRSSAYLFAGGSYNFKQCDFVNYWNGSRGAAAFEMRNWYPYENLIIATSIVNSRFDNCVFYGNTVNEFEVDTVMGAVMDFQFNACLMRREEIYDYPNYSESVLWNLNPDFVDPTNGDFHLLEGSPCQNAGDPAFSTPADIEGVGWGITDIGAYAL